MTPIDRSRLSYDDNRCLGLVPFPEKLQEQGIRLMRPEDREELLAIHTEVWGQEIGDGIRARWEWLLHDIPYRADGELIVPMLVEDGEIQCFHILVPHTFRANGRPWRVYMGGNLTGRESRRGGMITLNRALTAWPVARWGLVSYTFPHVRAVLRRYDYWRHKERGFEPDGQGMPPHLQSVSTLLYWDLPPPLVRVIRADGYLPGPAAKVANAMSAPFDRAFLTRPSDIKIREVDRFPEGLDMWLEETMSSWPLIQERSVAYLNWRYVDVPHLDYRRFLFVNGSGEPTGYAVIEDVRTPRGAPAWEIADMIYRRGDIHSITSMLRQLLLRARSEKIAALRATHNGDPDALAAHRRLGFQFRGTDDRKITLFRVPAGLDLNVVEDRANWPICAGDGDTRVV